MSRVQKMPRQTKEAWLLHSQVSPVKKSWGLLRKLLGQISAQARYRSAGQGRGQWECSRFDSKGVLQDFLNAPCQVKSQQTFKCKGLRPFPQQKINETQSSSLLLAGFLDVAVFKIWSYGRPTKGITKAYLFNTTEKGGACLTLTDWKILKICLRNEQTLAKLKSGPLSVQLLGWTLQRSAPRPLV